jgi:hypothetical protein
MADWGLRGSAFNFIQSIYELGLELSFWTFEEKEPVTTKPLDNTPL